MRLVSQLIKGISRALQKLLKYFDCTTILTFFVLIAAWVFSVTLALNLNDSDSVKVEFGSSL